MPWGSSRKLRIRSEVVAHLLRVRGCVLTRDVANLGFTEKQAEYTLRHLASDGRAAHLLICGVSLWCYSEESAVRHIRRLMRALHGALCSAGVRYATPKKAVGILLSDKKAGSIFTRYVILDVRNTATRRLITGLLALAYGGPAYYKAAGNTPVFAAACGKKRLPPLRLDALRRQGHEVLTIKVDAGVEALPRPAAAKDVSASEPAALSERRKAAAKPYRSIAVKVDPQLRRDLKKAAEAMGVSTSELVRRAIKHLLERHKTEHAAQEAHAG